MAALKESHLSNVPATSEATLVEHRNHLDKFCVTCGRRNIDDCAQKFKASKYQKYFVAKEINVRFI